MNVCVSAAIEQALGEELRGVDGSIELTTLRPDGALDPPVRPVDVLYKSEDIRSAEERAAMLALARSGALGWLHTSSAGIDNAFYHEITSLDVTFTHSPGVHALPMAEWVLAQMLHFARRAEEYRRQQARHEWRLLSAEELRGRTLGIVGYGGVGHAVARLARHFGMRTVATKRHPVEGDPDLDRWLPPDRIDELIAASDYLVLSAPLTDETRGLIDRRRLALMKPSAVLLNVARGALVDEPALVELLRAGRIRGAALDVFADEPLPVDSALWDLPNCVITPHASGESTATARRTTELFIEQLRRYLAGEALMHVVSKAGAA